MKKIREYGAVCTVGALGYSTIELLWRGHTHWTMALTGSIGFLCLYTLGIYMNKRKLFIRCFAGCMLLTGVEFTAGCIVNLWFHMQVWDYSSMPGNLLGQICPQYSLLWFLLCFPVLTVGKWMYAYFHGNGGVSILFRKKESVQLPENQL